MVTMSGTTIRDKDGGVSVLGAAWIHAGPGAPPSSRGRASASPSDAFDDTPPLDIDRNVSPRNSVKRSSCMSAKKLEIPEALTEEDSEYDDLSGEKGGTESPSGESGAVTPKIHTQDVDASPASSPGFGKSFDIHDLLRNVKGIPTDPDKKAAIHAV